MNWRRTSRLVIVLVTVATLAIALLAGHVTTATRPHATSTVSTGSGPTCVHVTAPVPGHKGAIKCR